jgi:hypothetical protein
MPQCTASSTTDHKQAWTVLRGEPAGLLTYNQTPDQIAVVERRYNAQGAVRQTSRRTELTLAEWEHIIASNACPEPWDEVEWGVIRPAVSAALTWEV